MKAIIKASIWLALCSFVSIAQASLLEVSTYNNIAYFADDQSTTLKRYSLVDEKFLTPITLTAKPKAVHVDSSGIYVSYGTKIFKLGLDGKNAAEFNIATKDIYDIESTDNYLIISGHSYLQTLNKANGNLISTSNYSLDTSPYISLSADKHLIFNTSEGTYPANIHQMALSSTGIIGKTIESRHYVHNQIDGKPVPFPTQNRVVDSRGNVYNALDLTLAGNLGDVYQDMAFWQGLPIVLRENTLQSYNKALVATGSYTLPQGLSAQKIVVYLNKVFVFGFDTANTFAVNKYDVALTSPADPAAAIDPNNLAYTPDDKALDKNQDTIYLLSKANLSIFRWSISKAAYLSSIPLTNAPLQFSYANDQGRIYLSYANGAINYIDLADNIERTFTNLGVTISAMTAAGQHVIARTPTETSWGVMDIFSKDGTRTAHYDLAEPTSNLVWDAPRERMYLITEFIPKDFCWNKLNVSTGAFEYGLCSPYHDNAGWGNPIRISDRGKLIALATGRIVDDKTLTEVGRLGSHYYLDFNFNPDGTFNFEVPYYKDLTWLLANVFTIRYVESTKSTRLERWKATYSQDDSATYDIQGSPIGLLPIVSQGKLVLIYSREGKPRFEPLSFSPIDSDNDGHLDPVDAFPADASEWADLDGDDIGDNSDPDVDGDGVFNAGDAFPIDKSESVDTDKDGIGNNADTDDDNDGTPDIQDKFPLDPLESKDMDNDGIGDNSDPDIDGDGALNVNDRFPLDRTESLDADNDGIGNNADTDDDNDGVTDIQDKFPLNPLESKDMDNDGVGDNSDPDIDGDGVLNINDSFPLDRSETKDTDKDGTGNNADTDDDNDGVLDIQDKFPLDPLESKDMDKDGIGDNSDIDIDGDGVLNISDPFPLDRTESLDTDKDGIGNNADTDDDNDGVPDVQDALPLDPKESKDLDHDAIGDNNDPDIDGDGVLNASDPAPLDPTESLDTDKDGTGNNADTDDDNDGVPDSSDFYPTDASKSLLKAADFFPARKGSSWIFDFSNQPVVLNPEVKIAGKSILPFTFPWGYKLYLVGSGDQIQLLGFNLPTKDGDGASFTLDITLNTAINLTSNSSRSGNGNINITPTYGNRDLNWSATTQYLGSETVVVPAGQYSALHTRVDFSGTASIDGKNATTTYYADIWFAENVGIVKMNDNGQLINLVSTTIAAPEVGSSNGENTNSSGGGGSGGGGSISWLTLALLLTFCAPSASLGARKTRKSH